VSFAVGADAYDRFMGRYSTPLAPLFADFAGVAAGQSVLDVGCGPGALTGELVRRAGTVAAVDPSPTFVEAARSRNPDVDVREAAAERLPFDDAEFDAALAQLVVHFMADPVAGVREMLRVTRAGGTLAACVWDHGGGSGPLAGFWEAARELDPGVEDESALAGASRGDLERIFREAGPKHVEEHVLTVHVEHPSFEEWWEPFTLGVGPAGAYVAALTPERREGLRTRCRELHGPGPFTVAASVWAVRGTA
jgi:SAM-dependent methyltransferase